LVFYFSAINDLVSKRSNLRRDSPEDSADKIDPVTLRFDPGASNLWLPQFADRPVGAVGLAIRIARGV
jgi:hypothetical protein